MLCKKCPMLNCKKGLGAFVTQWKFFRAILPFFGRIYLEYLVTHVFQISYNAYDALEDSKVLQRLTELPQHAIKEHYLIHSFDATSTFKIVSLQSQVKQNFETLKPLVVKDIISENMAKKTSQSGLSYFHFKLTFSKKKTTRGN